MHIKLSKEDQVVFNDGLAAYEYINSDGRMDLEDFCVTLAACLLHDGTGLESRARPEGFHTLLLEIVAGRSSEKFPAWVQSQNIVDWVPELAYLYPQKQRTCIHVAALILYSSDWISLIGSDVLDIPLDTWRVEYFGWAQESWQFTHTFLAGFHHALFRFVKQADLKWANTGEVSHFETLQLAFRASLGFDEARQKLEVRNQAWSNAMERIKKAIDAGYCLEAISLTENFISHLLFNVLAAKASLGKPSNFNTLVERARPFFPTTAEAALLKRIDLWRRKRNDAIHNYISSTIEDLAGNTSTLASASAETAVMGENLAAELLNWYRIAAVDFIPHNFPRSHLNS